MSGDIEHDLLSTGVSGSVQDRIEQDLQRLSIALHRFLQYLGSRKLRSIPRYRYSALDASEIRLLEVLPAIHLSSLPLRGRIHTIRIGAHYRPSWECISYAWGSPILDHDIVILDAESDQVIGRVPVTRRLQDALLQLRHEQGKRLLWVDQVCIDQRNISERGAQVRMMKRIYASAERTVVWLGQARSSEDLALLTEIIDLLKKMDLSEDMLLVGVSEMKKQYPQLTSIRTSQLELAQEEHDRWVFGHLAPYSMVPKAIQFELNKWQDAVVHLFKSGWSRRAWVVQEFVVSAEVLVHYSTLSMSFSTMVRLLKVLNLEHLTPYPSLMFLSHHRNSWQERGTIGQSLDRDRTLGTDFITFLHQMQFSTEASDPRDKIFAFIGLKQEDLSPHIVTDYHWPTQDVYKEVALSIIQETRALDVLALSQSYNASNSKSQVPHLPSWVPDWHDSRQYRMPFYFPGDRPQFQSARNMPHCYIAAERPIELVVRGKEVARIMETYNTDFQKSNHIGQFAADYFEFLDGMKVSTTDLQRRYAILRTLLADGRHGPAQPIPYEISTIYDVVSSNWVGYGLFKEDGAAGPRDLVFNVSEGMTAVWDRDLFKVDGIGGTTFGLGDQYFQPGDIVCILYGSAVPVVLRRVLGERVDGRKWVVVGQCYLDGWMYGDFPLSEFWNAFEKRPDTFVLV